MCGREPNFRFSDYVSELDSDERNRIWHGIFTPPRQQAATFSPLVQVPNPTFGDDFGYNGERTPARAGVAWQARVFSSVPAILKAFHL